MILAALQTMLFGMLGIFVVMGIIIGAISLLNYFTRGSKKEQK